MPSMPCYAMIPRARRNDKRERLCYHTPMLLKRLSLWQFRNFPHLEFAPPPGVCVLAGRNGQGKTNLLEAVFLLSVGRSHRTSHDRELIRWEQPQAQAAAVALHADGPRDVAVLLTRGEGRGKQVRVGASPVQRIGEMMGCLTTVLFSPEDLSLVKDGPAARRRFLDMAVSQAHPAYFYALQRCARVLAQRNRLLREALSGAPFDQAQLSAWDGMLAADGARVTLARHGFMLRLAAQASDAYARIAGEKEALSVGYETALSDTLARCEKAGQTEKDTLAALEEALLGLLQQGREGDLRRGATASGPHRDDLSLALNRKSARLYASQGQQRSIALSLKLAVLDVMRSDAQGKETPVLLLDDVLSELDPIRRRRLLTCARGVQTLITATDAADLADARADAVYTVESGTVAGG